MNQQRATNRYKWLRTSSGILYMAALDWLLITCEAMWQATMWRMSFSLISLRLSNRMNPLTDDWVLFDRVIFGGANLDANATDETLRPAETWFTSYRLGPVKSRWIVLGCILDKQFQTFHFLSKRFGDNCISVLILFLEIYFKNHLAELLADYVELWITEFDWPSEVN